MRRLPVCISMCDTLYTRAATIHDAKAQSIALFLKCAHYKAVKDERKLISAIATIHNFTKNNDFKRYYFQAKDLLIALYLEYTDTDKALKVLDAYRKEAFASKEPLAIGFFYKDLGNTYFVRYQYRRAIENYQKCVDYLTSINCIGDAPTTYSMMAKCYFFLNDFDGVNKTCQEELKVSQPISKGNAYAMLSISYYNTNNIIKGNEYYDKYMEWRQQYRNYSRNDNNYHLLLVNYYMARKEYDKALKHSDSIHDRANAERYTPKLLYLLKKYKEAYEKKEELDNDKEKIYDERQNKLIAEYDALFENQKLKNEKQEAEIERSHLLVNQLKAKQSLAALEIQRRILQLDNSNLELKNKDLNLLRQHEKMLKQNAVWQRQQEKVKAYKLLSEKNAKNNILQQTIILLLVLFGIAYMIVRKRNTRKLKREMAMTERARQEAEKAKLKAIEADKQKSIFLQNVSHEIRTPLNSIVGFANLLTDKNLDLSDEECQEFTKLINTNSELLTTLVNDVLDLSRMDSGKATLHYTHIDISQMCTDVVKSIESRVPNGVELLLKKPTEKIELYNDETRIKEVLINFITNACKYTKKGHIVLEYKKYHDNDIVFSVTDTGIGIAPENAEKIFERFEKIDTFVQGTGLGLNICKKIAEMMNGKVMVDTTYTDGARLLFIIPLSSNNE